MKRISLQFYPADWRNNANLRRCSWEARGAWIEVICLMNDSDEFGVLRWPLKEIAQAIGAPLRLLKELADKQVLKGGDAGCEAYIHTPMHARKPGQPVQLVSETASSCWFSSRMIVDEWRRSVQGSGSRFESPSGSPTEPPNHSPSHGVGERNGEAPNHSPSQRKSDGATSSTTSSVQIPIPSVPNGTGGEPPKPGDPPSKRLVPLKRVTDPDEIIFGYGVPLLVAADIKEKNARSFLGMVRKSHGDVAVVNALRECIKAKPLQPLEWLAKALPPVSDGSKTNAQQALEDANHAVLKQFMTEDSLATK